MSVSVNLFGRRSREQDISLKMNSMASKAPALRRLQKHQGIRVADHVKLCRAGLCRARAVRGGMHRDRGMGAEYGQPGPDKS